MISLLQLSIREEQFLINLFSLLTTAQSSQVSQQVLEQFVMKGLQDVKSYGRVSVTMRFLWSGQDALHGITSRV